MRVQLIGLRKIPDRALRLVATAAAKNSAARVLVLKFLGPLPDVAHHILYAKGARAFRMSAHFVRGAHRARLFRRRNRGVVPFLAPRIETSVRSLRGILPFPFVRKALPCPLRVGTRVFLRNPGHWLFVPAFGEISV